MTEPMSVPLWLYLLQVTAVASWPTVFAWCWIYRSRARRYRELWEGRVEDWNALVAQIRKEAGR